MSGSLMTDGDPEELIPCPFDPVHRFRRKRMPYHLQKCGKNFNKKDFKVCPFNSRHVVAKADFQSHLHLCQDKGILEREMLFHLEDAQADVVPGQKGYTDVPVSTYVPPEPAECWDDSNVRVDINPRGGLFNDEASGARDLQSTSPQKKTRVREPPNLRDPVMTRGGDSEVFKLATTEVTNNLSPLVGKARGRGRGRGTGISPPKVGAEANGHFQIPDAATTAVPIKGVGLGRGRGVVLQASGAAKLTPVISPPINSDEEERKKARKLKKMLKQIFELQEKQEAGLPLNEDQVAKLSRKDDVLSMLEHLEPFQ